MKMFKQVLTISVAAALIASTMGFTPKVAKQKAMAKEKSYSSVGPLETLDVYSEQANYSGIMGGWWGYELKKKFNVQINIIEANNGDTVFNTRSAAQDLGDIVEIGNETHLQSALKLGLFSDMTSYMKSSGSYIAKHFAPAVTFMKTLYGGKSKKLYVLPNSVSKNKASKSADFDEPNTANYLLWSAYKKAGSPKLKTLEDLVPVLQKMAKARPKSDTGHKTYGVSLWKDWDGDMMLNGYAYSQDYGYHDPMGFYLPKADGTSYQSIFSKKGYYYRSLKVFHNLNKIGLLDPDSYSQTFSDMQTKFNTGELLSAFYQWEYTYNTTANTSNSHKVAATGVKGADGYVYIPIADDSLRTQAYNPVGASYRIGIGSKCKDKARAMKVIAWLYSPEGTEFNLNGPKGLCWTVDPKTKAPKLTAFGLKSVQKTVAKTLSVPANYGGGNFADSYNAFNFTGIAVTDSDPNYGGETYQYNYWNSYEKTTNSTDLKKAWSKAIGKGTLNTMQLVKKTGHFTVQPGTTVTNPVLNDITKNKEARVASIVKTLSWQMAMSKTDAQFNSLWNQMLSQSKAAGVSAVNAEYLKEIKAYQAACKKVLG